jgi:hypothetical protein
MDAIPIPSSFLDVKKNKVVSKILAANFLINQKKTELNKTGA